MPSGRWSRSRLMSMLVNPKTALVTCPEAVAMSVGRAKNARYVSELPSTSMSLSAMSGRFRRQFPVDDVLGDPLHGVAPVHVGLLDEGERVGLVHLVTVHQ